MLSTVKACFQWSKRSFSVYQRRKQPPFEFSSGGLIGEVGIKVSPSGALAVLPTAAFSTLELNLSAKTNPMNMITEMNTNNHCR
jgi:hypothetical protein